MTIRMSLILVLLSLILANALAVFVGYRGLYGQSAILDQINRERVIPLRDLKVISDAYAVLIVAASHKARNGNWGWDETLKSVTKAQEDIAKSWRAVEGQFQSSEGEKLFRDAVSLKSGVDRNVLQLIDIVRRDDVAGLDRFVRDVLYQSIDPLTDKISLLIDLAVAEAQKDFEASEQQRRASETWLLVSILFAVGVAAAGFLVVVRRVIAPLTDLSDRMRRMAEGDYAVEPPAAASGEMGRMAAAVAVFRENGIARKSVEAAQADDRARAEVERRRTLDGIAGQAEAEVGTIAH